MSPYALPEYAAFVAAMRAEPSDATAPLVCADWLDERGKGEHARFVRGCVRLRQLRLERDELTKGNARPDPRRKRQESELETFDIVNDLRPLIVAHCHEWTGGAWRRPTNPRVYDWPLGFLRAWTVRPLAPGSDRMRDDNALKRLAALVARQPVRTVHANFPAVTFAPIVWHLDQLAKEFRGVTFVCGGETVVCAA